MCLVLLGTLCYTSYMPQTKACSKCKEVKLYEDFYADSRTRSGRGSQYRACILSFKKAKYDENPEPRKAASAKYRAEHPNLYQDNRERILATKKRCDIKYRDRRLAEGRAYQAENPEYFRNYRDTHKEETAARSAQWAADSPGARSASAAKRLAAKLLRTPSWLTKQHLDELKDIYIDRPEGYHVGRIVPLQGNNVSGFHVPWNLQYLSVEENLRKGNNF